ncbi:MAG: EAL domain-containing protein [Oleiphilaceae bacterium]|nr:EAL domain-containing protein [Oleiphilaceae bacterium]
MYASSPLGKGNLHYFGKGAIVFLTIALTHWLQFNATTDAPNVAINFGSGLALAWCFVWGRGMTAPIFLAALTPLMWVGTVHNTPAELVYWLFYAFSLALQSLAIYLGYWQLTRQQTDQQAAPLASSQCFLRFMLVCMLIAGLSALLLNMNESAFHASNSINLYAIWQHWLANFGGMLIVTPLAIAARYHTFKTNFRISSIEYLAWSAAVLIIAYTALIFNTSILLLMTPCLIWPAARFGPRSCSLTVLLTSLLMLPELNAVIDPQQTMPDNSLPRHLVQISWLILIITALYFNRLIADRMQIEAQLEEIVQQRTADLNITNQELKDEVFVRQQAEKSFRSSSKRYRALIETAGIPIIVLDEMFGVKQWNTAAENLFAYSREEILGKNFIDLFIPPAIQDEIAWKFTRIIESGLTRESAECEVLSRDGSRHIMLWNMNHLSDDDESGQSRLLLIGQNITEIRHTQDQLHYLAHFDALTGTANRRLFEDRCEQAIQSAIRHKHQMALITLDIDHFKRINDTLGHDAGDEFLVTLAARLKNCIRREDTIARLGGDEFAVLLANVSGQDGAETVARNILESITKPIQLQNSELIITSSIGITLCPIDGSHYPDLLKNADMAMYRAKNAGRNNIQFYSPEMNEEMQRQLQIEQELRVALQQNQFELYYQPIIEIETGEIVAFEALIRWQHPQKGLVRPDYFLQVAEQTGQLHEIGKWVLENACKQGLHIQSLFGAPLQIALNLSSRQYYHPGLLDLVKEVTHATGFAPRNLILEMAESTITSNIENSSATLCDLNALGVSLTIDGFGTGLSSLRQLKQIPIDIIKIDRTFVTGISDDENDRAITETLLAIANQMDLRSFATGVETPEQEAFLKINGCRYAQGYLYSAPLPLDNLEELYQRVADGNTLGNGEQIFLPFDNSSDGSGGSRESA